MFTTSVGTGAEVMDPIFRSKQPSANTAGAQDDEAKADHRLTTGSTEKSACPLATTT